MNSKRNYPEEVIKLVDECIHKYQDARWMYLDTFLEHRQAEPWVIVDAREQVEMDVSVIPGSISMDELCADLESYEDQPILIYCTIGCRSGACAESLMDEGYETYNLWGGIIAWAFSGQPFNTPDGKTTFRVHVYDEKWNVVPAQYESVL